MMTHRDLWVSIARLIVRHWTGFTDTVQALTVVILAAGFAHGGPGRTEEASGYIILAAVICAMAGWLTGGFLATCIRPRLCRVGGVVQSDPWHL
jgi:hypothetical protein